MIQPRELRLHLPVELSNGVTSTTTKVWEVLLASYHGDLQTITNLTNECPELVYAQYNYTPPIHLAVREGHWDVVQFLLELGAYDPAYRTYPFLDQLEIIAADRGHSEVGILLESYTSDRSTQRFRGDNGRIIYPRTPLETELEAAVDGGDLIKTNEILSQHPDMAKDDTLFWGEGILLFPAKENNQPMIDLLLSFGAVVPNPVKWAQFYYFEHDQGAAYLLDCGMNPNTMSWQKVTLLHDMAQKGNLLKAELLLKKGADINPIDDEYRSTPLGLAVRWNHPEMVELLIKNGADVQLSGALWATPLAWARAKGWKDIESLLLKAGAE